MTGAYPQGSNWTEQKAWINERITFLRTQLEAVDQNQLQNIQGKIAAYREILGAAEPVARPGKGSQGYG